MKFETTRAALKATLPAGAALLALAWWDEHRNDAQLQDGIIVAYTAYLLIIVVVLLAGPRHQAVLLDLDDADAISYGRDPDD